VSAEGRFNCEVHSLRADDSERERILEQGRSPTVAERLQFICNSILRAGEIVVPVIHKLSTTVAIITALVVAGCNEGKMGPLGPAGPSGSEGLQGPNGRQGPDGERGNVGAAGAVGAQGKAGPPGQRGDPGPQPPFHLRDRVRALRSWSGLGIAGL
jgi:collagen triple helix repeat protein